ncbi:hypothetical protein GE09DRAFT_1196077 [Coniochaeta sp. 2T2.1]|nr:hypothetical protein GE09DRAFT_1196077 [Coniochaeta sp. 2T2.1]
MGEAQQLQIHIYHSSPQMILRLPGQLLHTLSRNTSDHQSRPTITQLKQTPCPYCPKSIMYTPTVPYRPRHASSPSILMLTPYQQRPCECRYCLSHPASMSPQQQPSYTSSPSTSSSSSTSTTTFYQPSYTQPPLSPVSNYTLLPTPLPRRGGGEGRTGMSSPPVSPRTVPRYTNRGREGGNTAGAGRRGTFGEDRLEAQIRGLDGAREGRGKKRSSAEMEQQHTRDREEWEDQHERDEWERLEREYVKRVRGWATAVIPVGGE